MMKPEFVDYLKSLGITEPILERANSVYSFYTSLVCEDMLDVFVSEYVTDEGTRKYENLWFFTKSAMMEAKNFVSEDDFDFVRFEKGMYWNLTKRDFPLTSATEKSRLRVQAHLTPASSFQRILAEWKASGVNCIKLLDIFKKYILAE